MGLGEDRGRDTEKRQAVHEVHLHHGGSGDRHQKPQSGTSEDLEDVCRKCCRLIMIFYFVARKKSFYLT